jgi:hypothetical protein
MSRSIRSIISAFVRQCLIWETVALAQVALAMGLSVAALLFLLFWR